MSYSAAAMLQKSRPSIKELCTKQSQILSWCELVNADMAAESTEICLFASAKDSGLKLQKLCSFSETTEKGLS